jgi:hypothetical protein
MQGEREREKKHINVVVSPVTVAKVTGRKQKEKENYHLFYDTVLLFC